MMTAVHTSETFARKTGAPIRSSIAGRVAPRPAWGGLERRREVRYETCDPVQVFLLEFGSLEVAGVIRDVSKSGLRVEIGFPVVPGERLKIRLRSQVIFGEIRYCHEAGDAYQAGVEIDGVYFSPDGTSRAKGEPDSSRLASHELARFIVDDQLDADCSELVESCGHRMAPVSNDRVQ